ncbi:hypothetical protein YC2023_019596 [Brassica napus]
MNAKTLAGNKSTSPRRLLGLQELIHEQQHWASLHKTSKSSYATGQHRTTPNPETKTEAAPQEDQAPAHRQGMKPETQNQGQPLRQTAQVIT